jgi:hypothetical protein
MTIPCIHRSKHHPSGNSGAAPARSRERAGWKVGEQATGPLHVQGSVLHMLIRSHGYVRAVHGPPFLLQYGIDRVSAILRFCLSRLRREAVICAHKVLHQDVRHSFFLLIKTEKLECIFEHKSGLLVSVLISTIGNCLTPCTPVSILISTARLCRRP